MKSLSPLKDPVYSRWEVFDTYFFPGFLAVFNTQKQSVVTEDSCKDCQEGLPCRLSFSRACIIRLINEDIKKATSLLDIKVLHDYTFLQVFYTVTPSPFSGMYRLTIILRDFGIAFRTSDIPFFEEPSKRCFSESVNIESFGCYLGPFNTLINVDV